MDRHKRRFGGIWFAAVVAAATALAGGGEARAQSALRGEIVIDGSSTVYPISEAVATDFQKQYPNVNVTVAVSGTGGGFKRFVKGETDVSDASRNIKWAEFNACAQNGIHFIEVPVAWDGLSVVVHPSNDWVDQLTVDQLKRIFSSENTARNWSDVNPDWPEEPINIYMPGADSGTFDYFKEVVVGDEGSFRSDVSTSEDDNVLVRGVAGGRDAIGFFGAAYYFNNKEKLRAVPIVNPQSGRAVLPTDQNVKSGGYAPFSRPLFIYLKESSLRRPEMRKFVEFYLDNAAQMAGKVDYVGLSDQMYQRGRNHYQDRLTGTHFWRKDGSSRKGALPEAYQAGHRLIFE